MASAEDPPDPNEKWTFQSNPFKILGITSDNPNPEDVRKAHRILIQTSHPDKAKGKEGAATKYNTAYNFLKNKDADELKKLASSFSGSASAYLGQDGLTNVLVDKTRSEEYRRVFKTHVNAAKETNFKDNFQSYYKQVFDGVSTQPEVKPEYNCHLCEEDFIQVEHHVKAVYSPYREFLLEGAEPGHMKYLENLFGKEVTSWAPPSYDIGDWRNEKLSASFHRWCEHLKPLKNDIKWVNKMDSFGKRHGEEAQFALVCLLSALDHSVEDICKSIITSFPEPKKVLKISDLELLLPAFLHVFKDLKDFRKLSTKIAPSSPRTALTLAIVNMIIDPNAEDNFDQLGEAIVKTQKNLSYAHVCFILGSCDLNTIASKMVSRSDCREECKQLATHYLSRTNNSELLESLTKKAVESKDFNSGFIYAWGLFNYFVTKTDIDRALRAMKLILPPNKYWKFLQAFVIDNRQFILSSEAVAEAVIQKIGRELQNPRDTVLDMLLGALLERNMISTSAKVSPLSGALHILYGDEQRYESAVESIMTGLKTQLDLRLVNGDVEFLLDISRIPKIAVLFKEILEQKKYLGSEVVKPQPGSTYHAGLLFIRGIYHYKIKRFTEMVHDFATAAMHTTSKKIPNAIATFLAKNPMIHEKILRLSCMQFQRLEEYIDDYAGDPVHDSLFLEVLQKASANEEPNLSASFSISRDKNNGPDLDALEKDILGRDDDDDEECFDDDDWETSSRTNRQSNSPTSHDYAEKAFNYLDLEIICHGISETICCLTMAAQYFFKAMLVTPEKDIAQKYGYRGVILKCTSQLKVYTNLFMLPVPMALHALRAYLSLNFRANQHFSEIIRRNTKNYRTTRFIDEGQVSDEIDDWQLLLNMRAICPIVLTDIFTIAEGRFALQFYHQLYNIMLKEKINHGLYSRNTPDFLFHHMYFNGVWGERISPENTGYEDEIPDPSLFQNMMQTIDEDDDSDGEKQRKHDINVKIMKEKQKVEEMIRQREELPLVKRIGFQATRENAMCALANFYGYDLADVETMMGWQMIRRTPEGFIDMKNRTLNFDGEQVYTKFCGVQLNPNTKTFQLMLEPAVSKSTNQPALFSAVDMLEIFGNKIAGAVLSFEDLLYPPNIPDYMKLMTPFHPFFKVMYLGITPDGANKESICGTNFLMTLYHLDLLAKIFTTGQEVGAKFPFEFRDTESNLLGGLSTELQNVLKPITKRKKVKHLRQLELVHRFWFEVEDVEQEVIQPTENNGGTSTIRFGNASVVLKTMQMMRGKDGKLEDAEHLFDQESPEAKFVRTFNEKMHLIEKEFPIIQRIKELAKISQCFQILYGNKENLEKDIPAFRECMQIRLPPTRPYSRCGGTGHTCHCCDWVPAVYHQMKVTNEQKLEYLFERFSMGTPENAVEEGERIRRLPSSNSSGVGTSSAGSFFRKAWDGMWGRESSSKNQNNDSSKNGSSMDMGKYDRLEEYRCYGGVAFNPSSVNIKGIPASPRQNITAWNNVMNLRTSTNSFATHVGVGRGLGNIIKFAVRNMNSAGQGGGNSSAGGNGSNGRGGGGNGRGGGGNGSNGGGGNGSDGRGGGPKVELPKGDGQLKHIFRNEKGHLKDTPENRQWLNDFANKGKVEGTDSTYGHTWIQEKLPDGRFGWAEIRGNRIINGGINDVKRPFNSKTGLKAAKPPNQK